MWLRKFTGTKAVVLRRALGRGTGKCPLEEKCPLEKALRKVVIVHGDSSQY